MCHITFLALTGNYSFPSVVAIAVLCGFLGFFVKLSKYAIAKKRVLKLEDEMLANHARILKLQKKITEIKNEYEQSNTANVKQMDDVKRKIS